jgi:LacI family transcriptional regulator
MMDVPKQQKMSDRDREWRGPTVAEIAFESRVGTATVDRVLNGRGNVREVTRQKVLSAFDRLKLTPATAPLSVVKQVVRRIAFLSDSGASYNATLEEAVDQYGKTHPDFECPFTGINSAQVDPIKFANLIERTAEACDGLVVVAREDLTINRAIRNVVARKVPIVCLTTDLPSSGRAAYVGSDQTSAGSTAAYLMGQMTGDRGGKILLVYSAPYRAQEERELGFRRVLRSEFNHLEIDDRVNSNDDSEHSYRNVMKYIDEHGAPVGIYNTVGGNTGIGKALKEHGLVGKVVFIGHELNANSRLLLESGIMNFALGHDVSAEVDAAVQQMVALIEKRTPAPVPLSRVRIYTKFSCN